MRTIALQVDCTPTKCGKCRFSHMQLHYRDQHEHGDWRYPNFHPRGVRPAPDYDGYQTLHRCLYPFHSFPVATARYLKERLRRNAVPRLAECLARDITAG